MGLARLFGTLIDWEWHRSAVPAEPRQADTRHGELPSVRDLASLKRVLSAGALAGCEALTLPSRRHAGSRFLHLLARAPEAAALRVLDVRENRLEPDAAAALASSTTLQGLRVLSLGGNHLGDDGARALGEARFDRLEALALDGNGIGDAGLAALSQAPWLRTVRTLVLAGNRVGPAGLSALAASPHLSALETLDLSGNPVGDDGAAALADAPGLRSLRALRLERARLTARAGWALAAASSLQPEVLQLKRNRLTAPALRVLLVSQLAQKLRVLGLAWNPIRDEGARLLAAQAPQPLAELNLTRTGLTDEGALALAASPLLTRLRGLELRGNRISADTAQLVLHAWRSRGRDFVPPAGPPSEQRS